MSWSNVGPDSDSLYKHYMVHARWKSNEETEHLAGQQRARNAINAGGCNNEGKQAGFASFCGREDEVSKNYGTRGKADYTHPHRQKQRVTINDL